MNHILEEAKAMQEELVKYRRHLHQNPELGFDVNYAYCYVEQQLKNMGYEVAKCGKCGLTAMIGRKQQPSIHQTGTKESAITEGESVKHNPTFLLRADMDALEIREETEVPFKAANGNMHACGHDMHTAMLLGAAKLLKKHEAELKGCVKLMFQPAEELLAGSKDMIEAGVLGDKTCDDVGTTTSVDAGMMVHVTPGIPLPAGSVIIAPSGVSAPAADFFEIQITGTGCHGSSPYQGIDPMIPAAHIILALQEITTREIPANQPATLTIGSIHGGAAANAIPETITLQGTLRCYDEGIRNTIKTRIEEICQSQANVFRAQCQVTYTSGCPTLINDATLVKQADAYMTELLGEDMAYSAERLMEILASNATSTNQSDKTTGTKSASSTSLSSGSEDFSYVSHKIPTIMFAIAAGRPEDGYTYPLHHPKVTFDENCLCYGSAAFAYMAMRWLEG